MVMLPDGITPPNAAPQISDTETWRDYRRLSDGQAHEVAGDYVRKHIPNASGNRDAVRIKYYDLHNYVMDVAAGAMDLPFRIVGNSAFLALMERWQPTLSQAWKLRLGPASIYPHVQLHRERLVLEYIWGDRKKITADPKASTEWDLIQEFRYSIGDNQTYAYVQNEAGRVWTMQTDEGGRENPVDGAAGAWGVIPVYPMYMRPSSTLEPLADRGLLDAFQALALQASDTEFRRHNRTAILYIRRDEGGATKVIGGSDMEMNPDTGIELGAMDQIGLVESGLKPAEDLEYIERDLQLWAKLKKLPPELFITASRAETGAAKSWDYAPLLELQQTDREAADKWLFHFIEYIRPILACESILLPDEKVSVRTVTPKRPASANSFTWAMGMEKLCRMRITSPVKIKSETEGMSLEAAERICKINDKQCEALGIPRLDAGDDEGPAGVSGDLASTEP